MVKIKETIIVEGRYDKNTVSQTVDTVIIETSGFGVFSDNENLTLIRKMAEKNGIVILTDSDGAGFVIRNHIKGACPPGTVKEAYIPDVYGKEKRKRRRSKEGKLGVEGMTPEVIVSALKRAGAEFLNDKDDTAKREVITKADLYSLGLSGTPGSSVKRMALLSELDLPERLTANGLLDVLNSLMSRDELENAVRNICPDMKLQ